ncbi:MAG: glycosyltransferase family 2 protein [Chloroflexia bacterium]|nr:glycosyltransferase family 2 protein [Chloroflexia bacterium]
MLNQVNAPSAPLGVAIVSYNTCDLLRTCLASLRRSPVATAIAVVDNGSRDESVAMMRREFPEVQVIVPEGNLGFAKGTNVAMQALCGAHPAMQYMMMLNPDTEVHDGALAALLDFLQAHPRVGVVSPRLLNSDGSLQRAAFRFPTPSMTCLELFPPGEVTPGRLYDSWWNGRYAQEVAGSAPYAIDHPLGACMVTRVAVLAAVGMLDESYFMYAEEVDWCQRVRAAGWVIWQVPAAVVTHVGGAS